MRKTVRFFAVAQMLLIVVSKLFVIASLEPWPLFENADDLATVAFISAALVYVASLRHNGELYLFSILVCMYGTFCLVESYRMLAEETITWQQRLETTRANDVTCYAKLQAVKNKVPNDQVMQDACRGSGNYYSEASHVLPGTSSPNDDGTAWIVFEWLFVGGLTVTYLALIVLNFQLSKDAVLLQLQHDTMLKVTYDTFARTNQNDAKYRATYNKFLASIGRKAAINA